MPPGPFSTCGIDGKKGQELVYVFMTRNLRLFSWILSLTLCCSSSPAHWHPLFREANQCDTQVLVSASFPLFKQRSTSQHLRANLICPFCLAPLTTARGIAQAFLRPSAMHDSQKVFVTIRSALKCSFQFSTISHGEISISSENSLAKALPPFPVWQFSKNSLKPTESPSQWHPRLLQFFFSFFLLPQPQMLKYSHLTKPSISKSHFIIWRKL